MPPLRTCSGNIAPSRYPSKLGQADIVNICLQLNRTASEMSIGSGMGPSLANTLLRGGSRLATEAKAPEWLTPAHAHAPSLQHGKRSLCSTCLHCVIPVLGHIVLRCVQCRLPTDVVFLKAAFHMCLSIQPVRMLLQSGAFLTMPNVTMLFD